MESREEILIELAMALLQQMLLCSSNSVGLRRSAAGDYGLQLDVDMQRRETNFLKALLVNYQFSWAIGELLLVFFLSLSNVRLCGHSLKTQKSISCQSIRVICALEGSKLICFDLNSRTRREEKKSNLPLKPRPSFRFEICAQIEGSEPLEGQRNVRCIDDHSTSRTSV
jgi:hypothetical protein